MQLINFITIIVAAVLLPQALAVGIKRQDVTRITVTNPPTVTRTTVSAPPTSTVALVPLFGQCGGINYHGPVECVEIATCVKKDDFFSSCLPKPAPTGTVPLFGQCGGIEWEGLTVCQPGSVCKVLNPFYSQCLLP